jgi:hypothetical protein
MAPPFPFEAHSLEVNVDPVMVTLLFDEEKYFMTLPSEHDDAVCSEKFESVMDRPQGMFPIEMKGCELCVSFSIQHEVNDEDEVSPEREIRGFGEEQVTVEDGLMSVRDTETSPPVTQIRENDAFTVIHKVHNLNLNSLPLDKIRYSTPVPRDDDEVHRVTPSNVKHPVFLNPIPVLPLNDNITS